MRFAVAVAAVVVAGVAVTVASGASTPLSKGQYIAKLRAANAASARADNAAGAAVGSKAASPAEVKALFLVMGKTHVAIGREFAAVAPPEVAAKANADFARAELVFGRQNEAIAAKLPTTRAALRAYIQSLKPPSGGRLLDRAIAELHAAGFRI
jgi:hypothetical protein